MDSLERLNPIETENCESDVAILHVYPFQLARRRLLHFAMKLERAALKFVIGKEKQNPVMKTGASRMEVEWHNAANI